MRCFDHNWTPENIAAWLKRQADFGTYDGLFTERAKAYTTSCTAQHRPSGSILLFTRDVGMHSSGWWKNPDYERCWHLSLSFRDPETGAYRSRDDKWSDVWIDAVFGPLKRLIWTEPPYYPEGKRTDCYHYRVFFGDPGFTVPILPRGDVYSKANTPAHWLSWSDLRAKLGKAEINVEGLPE